MIDTCEGRVSGTVARACVKRIPRVATASIDGVNPRPTRSARNVSMVMRTMFGGTEGVGGVRAHAADSSRAIVAIHFTEVIIACPVGPTFRSGVCELAIGWL